MANIINLKPKQKASAKKPRKKLPTSIKWQAFEFDEYRKPKSWYLVSGLIAFLLFLAALWSNNFLLVILVCLSYFLFVAFAAKKPKKIDFAVTPKGIIADNSLYDFDNLKSFWIFYDPPLTKEISLRSKKKIMPYIKIPLGSQNPTALRAVLIQYIPEKKHSSSFVDDFSKSIRY